MFALPTGSFAQSQRNPCYYTTANPGPGNGCIPVSSANPLPVAATAIIGGGFTDAATGTPISVTTGGVTGTLPVGTVVAAFNVGTTNTAYCKLGASATTSDIAIPPASWFAFSVGASTQLTCITSTSTTTVNMIGGSGLPTGSGGGSSGGGGAITAASGSYASGALSAGAFASGAGVDGWDLTQGATADAAATVGGTGTLSAKLRLVTSQLNNIAVSGSSTNPTSTLTLTSSTTSYTSGQLIANNATAGSVVIPSFAIANSTGGAIVSRLRLASNDTTSTAWAGFTIQIDLWVAAPTFTNGDRGTWLPATGAASHLATFSCAFPTPVWGDGLGTECAPSTGNAATVKLGSGTSIFWTAKAIGGSGVTGASKTLTVTAELAN